MLRYRDLVGREYWVLLHRSDSFFGEIYTIRRVWDFSEDMAVQQVTEYARAEAFQVFHAWIPTLAELQWLSQKWKAYTPSPAELAQRAEKLQCYRDAVQRNESC